VNYGAMRRLASAAVRPSHNVNTIAVQLHRDDGPTVHLIRHEIHVLHNRVGEKVCREEIVIEGDL